MESNDTSATPRRRRRHRQAAGAARLSARALATIGMIVALAAGCGGDDDAAAPTNIEATTATTTADTATTTADVATTTSEVASAGDDVCAIAERLEQEEAVTLFERSPAEIEAFFDASDDLYAAGLDVVPDDLVPALEEVRRKYADFARKLAEYGYDFDAVVAALASDPELVASVDEVDSLAFDPAAASLRDFVFTECGIVVDPFQLASS